MEAQDLENIEEEDPVTLSGSASVTTSYYTTSDSIQRRQPYGYRLSLNPTVGVYGIRFPFSFVITEQGDQFSQPFNRFGVAPEYKWIKAHIGYSSMQFSPLTMDGKTFLGGGVELRPGIFRFSAFYGRIKKPTSGPTKNVAQRQFKRNAFGAKIGVGTNNNYIDLIFFKAKDKLKSLDLRDSLMNATPARSNLVTGISGKLSLFKNSLVFKLDVAGSAFTRNIRATDLGDDLPGVVTGIYEPNITTNLTWAGKTSLMLNLKNFSFGPTYRRINPSFNSMGLNYISDDVEEITFNTSFSLLEGKLSTSAQYGIQRNNLNEKHTSKTTRNIGSLNINYNPSQTFGVSAQYSNFSVDQKVVRDTIINDSLLVQQVNHNINLIPRLTFVNRKHVHNIVLALGYQALMDESYANNQMFNANLNYSLSLIQSGWRFGGGLNYNQFDRAQFSTERYGFTLSANKPFFDRKMQLGLSSSYNISQRSGEDESGNIINTSLNASYSISSKHSLKMNLSLLSNNTPGRDFTEFRGSLTYSMRF